MIGKKVGVIGIPGKWSTEVLADALEAETGFRKVMDMGDIYLDLTSGEVMHDGQSLSELDGLAVKKISAEYSHNTQDRLELLRMAESRGIRVFSGVDNMLRLVNRLSCTVRLREQGIPMPDTVITEQPRVALQAVKRFGSAVFKPLFSTKARGMCVLDAQQDDATLLKAIEEFRQHNPMMYVQQKRDLSGWDLGMVFLGGEYQGTYARVAQQKDSWNTTINSGGRYQAYEPEAELIELGRRAQAPFEMDFTTVDVALTDQGPIVFEVSAFGGFKGALEGAGIQAAERYAKYIMDKLA